MNFGSYPLFVGRMYMRFFWTLLSIYVTIPVWHLEGVVSMNLTKENMKKLALLILFTIFVLAALMNMGTVIGVAAFIWDLLFPFILGGAIAFVLNVPLNFLERNLFRKKEKRWVRKLARPVSLILAILFVLLIIFVVLVVVLPELANTLSNMGGTVGPALTRLQTWGAQVFQDNVRILEWLEGFQLDWPSLVDQVITFLQDSAADILSTTFSTAVAVFNGVYNFFIGFVFSIYILLQKERLSIQVNMLMRVTMPEARVKKIRYICLLCHKTFSRFITGQCMEAVILGTMFFVAMSIIRLPYPLLMGVLIAFTALIPILGAFIGCAIGVILILMISPTQALIFLILFLVLQQLEENLIYPHVVGNSVGLPSIWVLAAVTVGGSLAGIMGMLVFIPLVSVLYTLLREWMYRTIRTRREKERKEEAEIKDENTSDG